MKNPNKNWVRLPLAGVENCRELGGYSVANGDQVNWHSFLRSSDMNQLTSEDIIFLKEYGVKTVIDLREKSEIDNRPNPLAKEKDFDYYNLPFAGQPITELDTLKNFTLGDFYVGLIEDSKKVKTIFNTIAQATDGGILFHCTAGKDRTGILAMLLLGLAGVERKDIVSNYEVTYTNMESFHKIAESGLDVPVELLYSKHSYIEQAYDYLIEQYQTYENYLQSMGIEQAVLEQVKERLIVD